MLRPKEVDYPDGGKITLSYSPTQLGQQNSISGDTEVQYDGYGRQSRVEVANGQSGSAWYQVDTCYDANGNATFNSYLYQGDGFNASKVCSGSGDTYIYDVLGRLTSAVRADGETQGYTYLGRSTESVDANGVTRISQVDGLGRTAIVCEVSSGANLLPSGTTAASCGTDITGTGFTTTYNYTLATGTTTITQGAQTRTFVSDWLGRTTSNTEPERGTTNYNYQYNSTGLVVTRTRPKANQTSATVLTTTTTQFDALGRVLTISYDDGITPTKTFAYDAAAGADFTDLSQVNLKSRLSVVSVANAGTAFSYDPMGRTSALDECLPSGPCGATGNNHQLLYTYDLAGNMLTSTDGSGTKSTFTVSPASEPLSLTSSLGNSTNPANIVSNVQNGPNGPVNYGLGNGLAGVFHYDTLGRLNGGWVCSGSTGASCSSGTQLYGFTNTWKQQQLSCSSDTALNQGSSYGYDGFNRLTSLTVNSGSGSNYSWDYDRWGNRWQQNVLSGTGWPSSLSFNIASNRISVNGYSYDAVGNMTQDGFHSYTHDAEGNITAVDAGGTATYVYNALNQRVRAVVGGTITEYVFNAAGERASEWNGTTLAQLKGKYYLGTTPVAYYSGGATHFEHQDWLGTERMRTSYNGSVEGTFTSLPWGDGQSSTGADSDAYHFAMLDHDSESDTDHAQFRQYSNRQGNWLSPDPYSGSYDISNPQSFNRYVYALNNPLSNLDPSGLDCTSGDNYGFDLGIPDSVSFDGCPDSGALIRMYGWAPYPTDLNSISASYIGQQLNTLPSYSGVNFSGSPISFDGGGGGGGAPNNGTPWYKNSCVTSALAKGAASAGIDAIGLLPEGGVVSAALSGFHGAAGVSNGTNILQRVQMGAGLIGTANSASGSNVFAGLQAGVGVVGIAKALGAAIPVAGQVIAGVSVGLDIVGTGMEIANCH
jgi:RHS repeat-associated protein